MLLNDILKVYVARWLLLDAVTKGTSNLMALAVSSSAWDATASGLQVTKSLISLGLAV